MLYQIYMVMILCRVDILLSCLLAMLCFVVTIIISNHDGPTWNITKHLKRHGQIAQFYPVVSNHLFKQEQISVDCLIESGQ